MPPSSVRVTIAVAPRERFSYTQASLESIYANTTTPFELVYIDGGSPDPIKKYLETQSQLKGFKLIRVNHFLPPNHARNLALAEVKTEFVVFIDNDVIVQPGWLDKLLECADETGATLVGPLTCEREDFSIVHILGGSTEFRYPDQGRKRWMIERRPFMKQPVADVAHRLHRESVLLLEFHCVMARTEIFERIGLLDEGLLSMAEEGDFALQVLQAGGTIYTEPTSVVSYIVSLPIPWRDLPFFFVRWSNAWCESSVERMREKWDLSPDSPCLARYRDFVHVHAYLAHNYPGNEALKPKSLPWILAKGWQRLILAPIKKVGLWIMNQEAEKIIKKLKSTAPISIKSTAPKEESLVGQI